MKRLILVAALALAGCATHASSDFRSGDAEGAIRKNTQAFAAAANKHDADAMAAFYGDDAMLLPNGAPMFHGKDGIKQFWAGLLATGSVHVTLTTDDVLQSGDLAVETGHFELDITPTATGTGGPYQDHGKYVVVWSKLDGQWKIERDIFNSNSPLQ